MQVKGSPLYKGGAIWTADDDLYKAKQETSNANLNGVDTMSWWCDKGGGSVAGMAYVGSLCSDRGVNLNEYQYTTSASGFVSIVFTFYTDF